MQDLLKNKTAIRVIVAVLIVFSLSGLYLLKNYGANQKDDLSGQAGSSLPLLVDLGSGKCTPCKKMTPILAELKEEYKGKLVVEVVDIIKDKERRAYYEKKHPIPLIPTQILYDAEGNEVWSHEGYIPKEDLVKIIEDKLGVK